MAQNNNISTKLKFVDRPDVAENQKLTATEFNEMSTTQKLNGVTQGIFDETNIVIDGKGTWSNKTYNQPTLTLTAGASVATSGDNYKKLRVELLQSTTVSFAGNFDSDQLIGLPEGNIFAPGIYQWVFFHDPVNSKMGFHRPGGGGSSSAIGTSYDASGETGGNVPNTPDELQTATKQVRDWVNAPLQDPQNFSTNYTLDGIHELNDYAVSANETWNIVGTKGCGFVMDLVITGTPTITKGTGWYKDVHGLFGSELNSGTYRVYGYATSKGVDVSCPDLSQSLIPVPLPQITGLSATPGDGTIGLTWSATSGNAVNLSVERSLNGTSGWFEVGTPLSNATSFDDNTVSNGTPYYYRVREIGDTVNYSDGPYSSVVNATPTALTQLNTPSPSILVGNTQLQIYWDAIANADGYDLYVNTINDFGSAILETGYDGVSLSYLDAGLTNTQPYYYWVIATDSGGTYADSNAGTATGTPIASVTYSVTDNKTGIVTAPSGIAVDNANQKAYVLEQTTAILRKIDIGTWIEDSNIDLGTSGAQLAIDETNGLLYATKVNSELEIIDLATFTRISGSPFTMTNMINSVGVDIDQSGNKLYIGDIGGGIKLEVYNLTTRTWIKTIDDVSLLNAFGLMLNSDKTFMYICDTIAQKVHKLDLSDDSFTAFLDSSDGLNASNRGIVVDQFNDRILVTKGQETTCEILVFDFAGTLIDSFTVPGGATTQLRQIAFNSNLNEYYLCNTGSNEITVFAAL